MNSLFKKLTLFLLLLTSAPHLLHAEETPPKNYRVGISGGVLYPYGSLYGVGADLLVLNKYQLGIAAGAGFFDFIVAVNAIYRIPLTKIDNTEHILGMGAEYYRSCFDLSSICDGINPQVSWIAVVDSHTHLSLEAKINLNAINEDTNKRRVSVTPAGRFTYFF